MSKHISKKTQAFYENNNYKVALKERLNTLKETRPQLNLKKLASLMDIQYTFLSKVFNQEEAHLGEDQLFKAAEILEFLPDEIDFLILLRSYQTTSNSRRREYCQKRIEEIRRSRTLSADLVKSNSDSLREEMQYLFNPLCILIHVSLFIKEFQKKPELLCHKLGLTHEKLKECLIILEKNNYIVTGDTPTEIKEVKNRYPHFGPDHPLMRLHQSTMKNNLLQKMTQVSESEKDSFFVTFTMDEETFQKVKKQFREFLNQVQQETFNAKHQHVYQLSFDLLKYF